MALVDLVPLGPRGAKNRLQCALRLIMDELSRLLGEPALARVLGASWAGDLLLSMQQHASNCEQERLQCMQAEERARMAMAEQKRSSQERHRLRLSLKIERDRRLGYRS